MSPAVERVKEPHGLFFMLRGKRLHDGAEHDFQKPAAQRVNRDGQEKPGERGRHDLGQERQADEPCSCRGVGNNHGRAVADPVNESGGQAVHQELDQEIHRDQQGNAAHGDVIGVLKSQK